MSKEMESRRSIRAYSSQPVEEEKVLKILESARIAPSGSNTQPWRFLVVRSEEKRKQLAALSHDQKWMIEAPVHIVCIADISSRIEASGSLVIDENSPQEEVKQCIRDTAIAIEHMALEAAALGLGTCWVAWFTQEEIRPALRLPADKFVVAILPVGYAAEQPAARPRKPLADIVRFETWE